MGTNETSKTEIVHKWVSCCLLLGFVYYWLFTFSLVFFNRPTRIAAPRQSLIYSSFFNQNWRLFAFTKEFSSDVKLVIRKVNDTAEATSISLVRYSMAEKRKYAPFNNYQDALEKMLHVIITDIEGQAEKRKLLLKKQFPGQQEDFYVHAASVNLENDSLRRQNLKNLRNYGKYVLAQKHIDTTASEFQLVIVHNYIKPAIAPVVSADHSNEEVIFISTFQPL